MSHLVDTTEMYLKAVYELEEEGVVPLRARLVERLEQSKPTVSETVARLERDGLLRVENNRLIVFTPEGRAQATCVMRKHRLAERLLLDVLGLEWADVHEEACRWEHVMSDTVSERLVKILDQVDVDPYGNPIPDSRGVAATNIGVDGLMRIRDAADSGMTECTLVRIAEVLQTDPGLLAEFAEVGVVPGATVRIAHAGGVLTLSTEKGAVEVSSWVQAHLFVK